MANLNRYFATDVMRFFADKFDLEWPAPEEIDVSSPFTGLIQRTIDSYLRAWDSTIVQKSQRFIVESSETPREFKRGAYKLFRINNIKLGKEKHFFELIIVIARVATILCTDGMHVAPDVAVEVIEGSMHLFQSHYNVDIYHHFNQYCEELMGAC